MPKGNFYTVTFKENGQVVSKRRERLDSALSLARRKKGTVTHHLKGAMLEVEVK